MVEAGHTMSIKQEVSTIRSSLNYGWRPDPRERRASLRAGSKRKVARLVLWVSKATTRLRLCHGRGELLLGSRRWWLQWLTGAENLQEGPRPSLSSCLSVFLPHLLLAESDGASGKVEKRFVQSQPQNHTAECRRATFKLRDHYRIIKLSVSSHMMIQLSLVLSSCLTAAAVPPGRHNTMLSKQVLNFGDVFPSFPV